MLPCSAVLLWPQQVSARVGTWPYVLQVHYNEFIPEFEKQYPEFPWSSVQVSPKLHWEWGQAVGLQEPPLTLWDWETLGTWDSWSQQAPPAPVT